MAGATLAAGRLAAALLAAASTALADGAAPTPAVLAERVERLSHLPSPTGDEEPLRRGIADGVRASGAARSLEVDGLGNLLVNWPAAKPGQKAGTGRSGSAGRWLLLAPLDDPAMAVSGITQGGWLRLTSLSRPVPPAGVLRHWVGSQVWILGKEGPLAGVVALPSIHLQRGREGFPPMASEERLYVDTGEAPGAAILDRVVPRGGVFPIGAAPVSTGQAPSGLVGFGVGQRAIAAAVIEGGVSAGRLAPLAFVAQSRFGGRGLESLRSRLAPPTDSPEPTDTVLIIEPATEAVPEGTGLRLHALGENAGAGAAIERLMALAGRLSPPLTLTTGEALAGHSWREGLGTAAVLVLRLPVERRDTEGETVATAHIEELARLIAGLGASAVPIPVSTPPLAAAPEPPPAFEAVHPLFPAGPLLPFAHMPALIGVAGVSGLEGPVRETIRRLLPTSMKSRAHEDEEGNLILDLGSGAPHRLFIAHMDEIGYRVTGIEADGRLRVGRRGSFYDSVLLHRPVLVRVGGAAARGEPATSEVRGVLELADRAEVVSESLVEVLPEETLRVDIGAGSPEDVTALGVAVGDGITVPKRFERLGPHRAYGRGVDDRAGCAALIAALHALAPEVAAGRGPGGRLTFVWSVREEVGLEGAKALAARLDPDEVLAVDTFVSSDSPLERDAFALAPLGWGAVLRAADNSNLTPLDRVRAVVEGAGAAGIPLQTGVGRGGNDGAPFALGGAPGLPISWPGRYSHSPVEVIDSRDHEALVSLILWVSRGGTMPATPGRP